MSIRRGLLRSLIAHWPLDEPSGTRYAHNGLLNLTDNNTVMQRTLSGPSPVFPYAPDFVRANSESLSVASTSDLQMGSNTPFTISVWCYLDAFDTNYNHPVWAKWNNFANMEYALYREFSAPNQKFRFLVSPDGTTISVVDSTTTMLATTWYHVVCLYDRAYIRIYLNSVLEASTAFTAGLNTSTYDFVVGSWKNVAAPTHTNWDGNIVQLCIWKRALAQQEITWLYNSGKGRWPLFPARTMRKTSKRRVEP